MLVLPRYARQDEIVFGANKNADNYDSTKTTLNVENKIIHRGKITMRILNGKYGIFDQA